MKTCANTFKNDCKVLVLTQAEQKSQSWKVFQWELAATYACVLMLNIVTNCKPLTALFAKQVKLAYRSEVCLAVVFLTWD